MGSTWGFAVETFDSRPSIDRQRAARRNHSLQYLACRPSHQDGNARSQAERQVADWPPSAGKLLPHNQREFRTQALSDVILEVGSDRILYSVDDPLKDLIAAKDWFDHAEISESERSKIGRSNPQKLFPF